MTISAHNCPAPFCSAAVPDRLFACKRHWFALSEPVRSAIYATAGKSLLDPDRLGAVRAAYEEWRQP